MKNDGPHFCLEVNDKKLKGKIKTWPIYRENTGM